MKKLILLLILCYSLGQSQVFYTVKVDTVKPYKKGRVTFVPPLQFGVGGMPSISELPYVKADSANVASLVADSAEIGSLVADSASAGYLKSDSARIGVLWANEGIFGSLYATSADIGSIVADSVRAAFLRADSARIGYLMADSAKITWLRADSAHITYLMADSAKIGWLRADSARIGYLMADSAKITWLRADSAHITYLMADSAKIGWLRADSARIGYLMADSARISYVVADSINVGWLVADSADFGYIKCDSILVRYTARINGTLYANGIVEIADTLKIGTRLPSGSVARLILGSDSTHGIAELGDSTYIRSSAKSTVRASIVYTDTLDYGFELRHRRKGETQTNDTLATMRGLGAVGIQDTLWIRNPSDSSLVGITYQGIGGSPYFLTIPGDTSVTTDTIMTLAVYRSNVAIRATYEDVARTSGTLEDDATLYGQIGGTTSHDYPQGSIWAGYFDLFFELGTGANGIKIGLTLPDSNYTVFDGIYEHWKAATAVDTAWMHNLTVNKSLIPGNSQSLALRTSYGFATHFPVRVNFWMDNRYGFTGPFRLRWASDGGGSATLLRGSMLVAYRIY